MRQVTNFGNPFLMRVGERETLAQLKPRIQARVVHLDRVRIPYPSAAIGYSAAGVSVMGYSPACLLRSVLFDALRRRAREPQTLASCRRVWAGFWLA